MPASDVTTRFEKGAALAEKHGVKTKAYQVEVSDPEKVQKAIQQVVQDFGKMDVFVANAGMAISKPIIEQTIEEYRKQMSVNREFQNLSEHIGKR